MAQQRAFDPDQTWASPWDGCPSSPTINLTYQVPRVAACPDSSLLKLPHSLPGGSAFLGACLGPLLIPGEVFPPILSCALHPCVCALQLQPPHRPRQLIWGGTYSMGDARPCDAVCWRLLVPALLAGCRFGALALRSIRARHDGAVGSGGAGLRKAWLQLGLPKCMGTCSAVTLQGLVQALSGIEPAWEWVQLLRARPPRASPLIWQGMHRAGAELRLSPRFATQQTGCKPRAELGFFPGACSHRVSSWLAAPGCAQRRGTRYDCRVSGHDGWRNLSSLRGVTQPNCWGEFLAGTFLWVGAKISASSLRFSLTVPF
ncbi:hypothetical protein Anapl_09350 [Anas platyrhynchos]|uniref:Uncharacterized protein n=1 Tax=Anas platyrhynchos TaxID=8839 RepID=R0JY87_ANAPL|nr:hypothetical protein Anapl_09350 [Anas platyrhynchos]